MFIMAATGPALTEIPNVSLPEYILASLDDNPEELKLTDGLDRKEYTRGQLKQMVCDFAHGLQQHGVLPGDTVAVLNYNNVEFIVSVLAAQAVGATVTLVNILYMADEIKHHLTDSLTSHIIVNEKLIETCEQALTGMEPSSVQSIIVIGHHDSHITFESILKLGASLNQTGLPSVNIDPKQQVALLPYSSGTTGLPKGVMLTHYNIITNLIQIHTFRQMIPPQTSLPPGMTRPPALLYLPVFHMMGMCGLLLSLRGQVTIVLLPRFLPEPFLQAIQDFKIMHLSVVPSIASFLLKSPLVNKYDTTSLKVVSCGGAPLKKETAQALQKRFLLFKVSQGYGMTELTTGATFPSTGNKDGSAGTALPGTEIRIVDPDTNNQVESGDVGEVWVRGPQVMKGYFGKPKATAETVDTDGWLHTGDVGYIDEDGFLFVVDRLKELIKYKAYQVAPAELEAVLLAYPGIDDVGVVGVPDEDGTNELPLAMVVKSDPDLTEEEVLKYVEERVAPYKKLRGGVKFIDQVPRTASGKIMRRMLKALL